MKYNTLPCCPFTVSQVSMAAENLYANPMSSGLILMICSVESITDRLRADQKNQQKVMRTLNL
jgi:hypothetical protein